MSGLIAPLVNRQYKCEHVALKVRTIDGVRISGVHLARERRRREVVVYCHGFLGSKNFRSVPSVLDRLSSRCDVIAFDFRGHGGSSGVSTLFDREVLDVRAIVEYAKECGYDKVALFGESMGGSAAICYAGEYRDVGGVAAVAPLADDCDYLTPLARGMLRFLFQTRSGRRLAETLYGARLGQLPASSSPLDLVGAISPIPTLLIHGRNDPLVRLEGTRALYERAGQPKALQILDRGVHAFILGDYLIGIVIRWLEEVGTLSADAGK